VRGADLAEVAANKWARRVEVARARAGLTTRRASLAIDHLSGGIFAASQLAKLITMFPLPSCLPSCVFGRIKSRSRRPLPPEGGAKFVFITARVGGRASERALWFEREAELAI